MRWIAAKIVVSTVVALALASAGAARVDRSGGARSSFVQPAGTSTVGPPTLAASGSPGFQNLTCPGSSTCTYVQFSGTSVDSLYAVPLDGTIVGWRISAGSAGSHVTLRILRPAGGGKYTAVESSAPETTSGNAALPDEFLGLSLPVKSGDVIALDNASSALIFKTGVTGEVPNTFTPSLADGGAAATPTAPVGSTAAGYQLQIDAYLLPTPVTTTTSTTTTSTTPGTKPPVLARLTVKPQSFKTSTGAQLSYRLSRAATVKLVIRHQLPGRRVNGRCVNPLAAPKSAQKCTRSTRVGSTKTAGVAGVNKGQLTGMISGKTLAAGHYKLTATATNSGGVSKPESTAFTILP